MPKLIPLSQGQFAIVDDEDFEYLNQWKWFADKHAKTYYAVRNTKTKPRTIVSMHKQLTGFDITDHIDCNGLNNCKSNLRKATYAQNAANRRVMKNSKTGVKGVSIHTDTKDREKKMYVAHISFMGKQKNLGWYPTIEEASEAYKKAAEEIHGEFKRL
mgnify:CR=1 FL=1